MQIRCMTGGAERKNRLTATLEVAAGGRSGDDLLAKSKAFAGTIKPDSAGYGNSSGDADFFRHRRRSCVLAVSAASSKPSRPWPLFAMCQVMGISKQGYCRSSGDRKWAGEATCSWNGSTTSACRKTKRMAATMASDGSFLGSRFTVAMLTEIAGSTASAGNTA